MKGKTLILRSPTRKNVIIDLGDASARLDQEFACAVSTKPFSSYDLSTMHLNAKYANESYCTYFYLLCHSAAAIWSCINMHLIGSVECHQEGSPRLPSTKTVRCATIHTRFGKQLHTAT